MSVLPAHPARHNLPGSWMIVVIVRCSGSGRAHCSVCFYEWHSFVAYVLRDEYSLMTFLANRRIKLQILESGNQK